MTRCLTLGHGLKEHISGQVFLLLLKMFCRRNVFARKGELDSDQSRIGEEEGSPGLGIMGPRIERQCFGLVSGLHIYTYTQPPLSVRPALTARALTHMKTAEHGRA